MARANRLRGDGAIFHLTDRCHNRDFLLKFARDRNAYRELMREHLQKYEVSLLDYCITCNHVHLIVDAAERQEISGFMQEVASEFARAYNRRKGRRNAFWGDNFHATAVESGEYLWNCLCYVELNMVRCGVVKHPRDWQWVGYQEIMGGRSRYRLIDLQRLCWRLGVDSVEQIRRNLEESLAERIAQDRLKREPRWTESLALGSMGFVEKVKSLMQSRQRVEMTSTDNRTWMLREQGIPYGQKTEGKSVAKHVF